MELCKTLHEFVETWTDISDRIITDALDNMFKMHGRRFVHRDIKPNNMVFSTLANRFVFIDYGISEVVKESYK